MFGSNSVDKNVHPAAAALVISVVVLAIGGWLWCSHEAKRYGGPAGLAVDPSGHLYIQVQNTLLEHDVDGRFIARHDLATLGVGTLLGDVAFFSNGDVLLRRGEDTRSMLDTVRAYLRQTNRRDIASAAPDTGLARCQLSSGQCENFGPTPIDFASAFSLYIDWTTDDVYISDSSRHLLRKYSRDGLPLAEPVAGFRFPNELTLFEGALLVADTNHHRIRSVDPRTDRFGQETRVAAVVPPQAANNQQRWPRSFLRVGDRWWVNNMQSGMNFGGIYEFDTDWRFLRQIALPDQADPIAMIEFGDSVLITDWYGDRVHRLSTSGDARSDFDSEGLREIVEHSEQRRRFLMVCAWSIAALGVGLCVIVLIRGTQWSRPPQPDRLTGDAASQSGPIVIEPNADHVRKLRRSVRLTTWLFAPLPIAVLALLYFARELERIAELLLIGLGSTLFIVFFRWMVTVNTSTSIAFDDNRATLKNHRNEVFRVPLSSIRYTAHVVATDKVAVFLGQGQMPLYDRDAVLSELEMRLDADQRLSEWAMQRKLIAMRHPNGVATALAGVIIAIVLALLLMTP